MHVDGGREWVGARRRAVEGWPGCMGEGEGMGGGVAVFVISRHRKRGSNLPEVLHYLWSLVYRLNLPNSEPPKLGNLRNSELFIGGIG